MLKPLFSDVDDLTGMVETFHFDPYTDQLIIENTQPIDEIIDDNIAFQNEMNSGWKGDMHRVASIPVSMLPELKRLGIMDIGGRILDQKALKRWLNDSDNRKLRVKLGGM